ncbi:MAG: c-type cytochrome [Candidatus Kapaibacteriota bacterium]
MGPFDPQLAAKGEQIFKLKCTSCHQYDKRLVGPPLRDVVKRRSADYIISMIVHPEEMQEKNDTVKALVKQYLTKMTNQNVSLEDAKAIYEHLRDISGQR